MIRDAVKEDADSISRIYNHYILNSIATFVEEPLAVEEIEQRIVDKIQSGHFWLVAEEKNTLIGYAYSAPWSDRSAYRHSVEISVYLDPESTYNGWGTRLYQALFKKLLTQSVHVVIGGIALPNEASVALHEKFGMEKVAHYKEVGYKFGQWIDVGYWQRTIELK